MPRTRPTAVVVGADLIQEARRIERQTVLVEIRDLIDRQPLQKPKQYVQHGWDKWEDCTAREFRESLIASLEAYRAV